MNEPIMPTFEPILIPEEAKKRKKKESKSPAVVIVKPEPEIPETPKETAEPDESRTYTIEDAFNYMVDGPHGEDDRTFHAARALRAVAYLLHWYSDVGNHPLDGMAANGLAYILQRAASEVADHPAPTIRYLGGPAPKDEPENTPEAS